MEKEILKIIREHFYNVEGTPEKSSKEITAHVMEFIEWKELNTFCDKISKNKVKYMLRDLNTPAELLDIKELYEFWRDNVKK